MYRDRQGSVKREESDKLTNILSVAGDSTQKREHTHAGTHMHTHRDAHSSHRFMHRSKSSQGNKIHNHTGTYTPRDTHAHTHTSAIETLGVRGHTVSLFTISSRKECV